MGRRGLAAPTGANSGIALPSTMSAAAIAAVVLTVYTAVVLTGWPGRAAAEALTDLLFPAFALFYVPLAVSAARSARGRLRAAWSVLTAALVCWALGELLWTYYKYVLGGVPFPSWADAGYLTYVPGIVAALLLFPTTRTWRDQSRLFLDGLIMTCSIFLISWLTVLRTVWQGGDGSRLAFVLSLAYPAGDVLIITVGLVVLIRTPAGLRLTMGLLVAALLCSAVGNGVWTYQENTAGYRVGGVADIFYAADALLIIVALVAANHARPGTPTTRSAAPNWVLLWLPLIPLVVAGLFVVTWDRAVVMEAPVVVTGVLLIVATLVRQIMEAAELSRRGQQVQQLADRLAAELRGASDYVASILPGELAGPVEVSSRYVPSRALGGDSFGYSWVDGDHLMVYLIDVSGHGVRPALLSVSVHNLLRSGAVANATLLHPDRVLAELNTRFRMENHDDHYSTMWYGVYRRSTGLLRYSSAGHPPPLAFTCQGGALDCSPLSGASLPLGMFADSEFTVESFVVHPGSRILIYSDGVLGDHPRMAEFAARCTTLAGLAPDWLDAIVDGLPDYADGDVKDDCSLVALTFHR